MNDGCHLGVVGHLAFPVAVLLHAVDPQAGHVAAEHSRDEDARSDLLLVVPLDLEHAPVGLDGDRSESLLLAFPFRFTKSVSK